MESGSTPNKARSEPSFFALDRITSRLDSTRKPLGSALEGTAAAAKTVCTMGIEKKPIRIPTRFEKRFMIHLPLLDQWQGAENLFGSASILRLREPALSLSK